VNDDGADPAGVPGGELLLHVCCGPCAVAVIDRLRGSGIALVAHFRNPNIHPALEFARRLEAFVQLREITGTPTFMEVEYGLDEFLSAVGDGEGRCRRCVALRLSATAALAAREGFLRFSTTLLISPYQRHEEVRELGEEAARAHGVEFHYEDFRPLFREGQERAKELGLYRQPYCGCIFSEAERYAGRLRSIQAAARGEG
jgi:epoxyqueuosine reductase